MSYMALRPVKPVINPKVTKTNLDQLRNKVIEYAEARSTFKDKSATTSQYLFNQLIDNLETLQNQLSVVSSSLYVTNASLSYVSSSFSFHRSRQLNAATGSAKGPAPHIGSFP
jgi:vacuolar-type H+-ATPase subunit D/Vma8